MSKKWVNCQVCDLPTTNINKLCICCWSVEANIMDYLKSEEGKHRIEKALDSIKTQKD